jgi:hypothetical protein
MNPPNIHVFAFARDRKYLPAEMRVRVRDNDVM